MAPDTHRAALQALVRAYEQLAPDNLAQMARCYAPDARFKDPFNEVQGWTAIERIFAHMFQTLQQPRFVVTQQVLEGEQAFLTWDFHFARGRAGTPHTIRGASQLVFNAQGQVLLHRDYWDAAEELYEHLPLIGALMRWLKRQLRA